MSANGSASINGDSVLEALRLGWSVAELRGRYSSLAHCPRTRGPSVRRIEHALPLSLERTQAEQAIKTECVVVGLASQMQLDTLRAGAETGEKAPSPSSQLRAASGTLTGDTVADRAARKTAWNTLTELLYEWDAAIQDGLASRTFGEASAYQLGRGLAETYWALDPAAKDGEVNSWSVLLGGERTKALTELLTRLSPRLSPLTTPAITASLEEWSKVASDEAWREVYGAVDRLSEQVRLWRDLLLTGRDPRLLVARGDMLQQARRLWPVVKTFWVEGIAAAASVCLLAVAAWLIGRAQANHAAGAVLGVVGFFGVTSAGLLAHAKQSANALLARLGIALDMELVEEAVTIVPPKPTDHP
jgi:hypothetical protein